MTGALEVLVEELSAERALRTLLPRIVPDHPFEVRVFRGKPDLLKKLPGRLAGYAALPVEFAPLVVVLVDRDGDVCTTLKEKIVQMADRAGIPARGPGRRLLARIAVEELEAWFFGDIPAVRAAFPKVPAGVGTRAGLRDPDAIGGGTAEALERILQTHGYHSAGLSKTRAAETIAPHMNVDDNSSRSFQVFRDGIRTLTATGGI